MTDPNLSIREIIEAFRITDAELEKALAEIEKRGVAKGYFGQSNYKTGEPLKAPRILLAPLIDAFSEATHQIWTLVSQHIYNRSQTDEEQKREKMAARADTILIFVCPTPDDAEVAVGDLMERLDKVRARRSARISIAYFYWELLLLTVTKAKKRLVGATIGPVLNRIFKGSS